MRTASQSGQMAAKLDYCASFQYPRGEVVPMRWPWSKREGTSKDNLPSLSGEQIVERLVLKSKALVDEIADVARAQIDADEQRSARLDSKAQTLLTTAGLSLTVAFTFGGFMLQHPETLACLGRWGDVVSVLYGFALALGLLSSWYAMHAMLIRSSHRGVDIEDALNVDELRDADAENTDDGAARRYKRYMAAHYWVIYQANFRVNEDKATTVGRGQRLFFAFLATLIAIGAAMTIAAFGGLRAARVTAPKPAAPTVTSPAPTTVPKASEQPRPPAPTSTPPSQPQPQPQPSPTRVPGGGQPLRKDEPSVPLTTPGGHHRGK